MMMILLGGFGGGCIAAVICVVMHLSLPLSAVLGYGLGQVGALLGAIASTR